ncbi:MAG: ABC transporter substrate-binding protein [Gammaproteobacteria bacterium]|nr:ABC transporter substrate-binding protein [Gammaproteobacteria bacterium]
MNAILHLLIAVLAATFLYVPVADAADPPLIRFGRGFAAEEQVWLMTVRPDLTPNQGKKYQLKQILFRANPQRFQAFLAGELDAGTAPGLAVIFARSQGVDMKIVASICLEAAGSQYFSTTYMAKEDGPVKTVKDLKGRTVGVVGIKTATDLWARAMLLKEGLTPDTDTKVVPLGFPTMGEAVRTGKVDAGTFVEPFYSAEVAKGGLRKLFTAVEAVGYDHELLDIWFGEKFLQAHPEAVRAFLADYVAVTKYYLANTEQAKTDLHKAEFVRTPLPVYLKNADWKRDADARVDVESLKKLAAFMQTRLGWLEKPVQVEGMVDMTYLPK